MDKKYHDVTITFHLLEEVTPRIFLTRVLEACSRYGALRDGEGASATTIDTIQIVKREIDSDDSFIKARATRETPPKRRGKKLKNRKSRTPSDPWYYGD